MTYSFAPGSARDLGYKLGPKSGVAFFQDAQGRYATFRGVNFAPRAKLAPYLPVGIPKAPQDIDDGEFAAALAGLQPQFDEIRELGWNVVRLLVFWKGLEPTPFVDPDVLSPRGVAYLRRVLSFIEEFHRRGIFVFLDFHQDIAHEAYNGDGFPDWALAIDTEHERPTDADFRHKTWQAEYTEAILVTRHSREVRHTLRSFWRDRLRNDHLSPAVQNRARQPRTHLAKTIGATARWLQANAGPAFSAILAYQLFNEPHQVGLGKRSFEEDFLPEYYKQATEEIRRSAGGLPGDDRAFVMVQPRVDWDVAEPDAGDASTDFTHDPVTYLNTDELDHEKTVFTYHHYDPWTSYNHTAGLGDKMEKKQEEWPSLYDKMRGAAVDRRLIPFMTEFGANHAWDDHYTPLRPELYHEQQTRAYIDLQMREADRQVLNWTYWNYNPFNTEDLLDGWNLEDFSLLGPGRVPRNHDLVCRPYPMRSSAEPLYVYFDAHSRVCGMELTGTPVGAPTVVYVPRRLHYQGDFDVLASSGRIEWDEGPQLLYWWPDPATTEHALIVSIAPFRVPRVFLSWLLMRVPYHWRLPEGVVVDDVAIRGIVADPPGRDIENEAVVLANPTEEGVDLSGWQLQDRAGHLFTFPSYTLPAGSSVRIWTKRGTDRGSDLFMGRGAPIWNNPGDEAVLLDARGTKISRFEY